MLTVNGNIEDKRIAVVLIWPKLSKMKTTLLELTNLSQLRKDLLNVNRSVTSVFCFKYSELVTNQQSQRLNKFEKSNFF